MPFVSAAQQRWGHSPAGEKALGPDKLAEFDAATKGKELPERVGNKPTSSKLGQPMNYGALVAHARKFSNT